jgi:hypothetical protein
LYSKSLNDVDSKIDALFSSKVQCLLLVVFNSGVYFFADVTLSKSGLSVSTPENFTHFQLFPRWRKNIFVLCFDRVFTSIVTSPILLFQSEERRKREVQKELACITIQKNFRMHR